MKHPGTKNCSSCVYAYLQDVYFVLYIVQEESHTVTIYVNRFAPQDTLPTILTARIEHGRAQKREKSIGPRNVW